MTRYNRRDVLRILHLQARHLNAWERAGLIPRNDQYGFEELRQLRTLNSLRTRRLSTRRIRRSLEAMQRIAGVRDALLVATAVQHGSRLVFRHQGILLDPMTRQLSFDFDAPNRGHAIEVGRPAAADPLRQAMDLQNLFLSAVQLEENAKTLPQAAEFYEKILIQHPNHAPSAINLGTIRYNQRDFIAAERLYRRATIADPEYALAFFDLGNVLDEMQRLEEAIAAYLRAITLVPQYADAHYNLALAYERIGERRLALRHWATYVRLDPVGPWASHARAQARKILSGEKLRIVSRSGQLVAAG